MGEFFILPLLYKKGKKKKPNQKNPQNKTRQNSSSNLKECPLIEFI